MTTRRSRKARVLVMSPDWTRQAKERSAPESSWILSAAISVSAFGERRRIVVVGVDWLCWQICRAAASPYSRVQRSTSQSGCDHALATASEELTTGGTGDHRGVLGGDSSAVADS